MSEVRHELIKLGEPYTDVLIAEFCKDYAPPEPGPRGRFPRYASITALLIDIYEGNIETYPDYLIVEGRDTLPYKLTVADVSKDGNNSKSVILRTQSSIHILDPSISPELGHETSGLHVYYNEQDNIVNFRVYRRQGSIFARGEFGSMFLVCLHHINSLVAQKNTATPAVIGNWSAEIPERRTNFDMFLNAYDFLLNEDNRLPQNTKIRKETKVMLAEAKRTGVITEEEIPKLAALSTWTGALLGKIGYHPYYVQIVRDILSGGITNVMAEFVSEKK
ncbi:MAG: hypothetical protein ACOCXP_01945 [Candidatus Dojkabacteria bacterium]